ncbi:indole-3-glycerol phosphate synthase [Melghirimyces profundicolus]|uniref:Indole-3-glycerol phosphate synthase n=1 Tax=Melghirimyces profundicolus TaxID=1242148 RepID=A0A2T6BV07_9BACL|nr:indole-3-glycerol phosphate synthase TrpC [Melghirimyces profundicolus]PTX59910.1 indole-3-glycerol phosphate synthase [Melghirimyces profundicolus]
MFLEKIVETKREEIRRLEISLSRQDRERARGLPPVRSLKGALTDGKAKPGLIAEVKPASPSKGEIRPDTDPVATARGYEEGGAAAVSVLTEKTFFKGRLESLQKVKEAVRLPVLRKDFILEPIQLWESRLAGADAVLLIASLLEEDRLRTLVREAKATGLEVLLEVHEEEELSKALAAEPDVLGINNRDLRTFVTDLAVTERLLPRIPGGIPVIGESGVHSRKDFDRLVRAGVHGVLIGEYLMRQESPRKAAESLTVGGSS